MKCDLVKIFSCKFIELVVFTILLKFNVFKKIGIYI